MKCLVLAGGNSERFWPLSRNDYPKQFMELREGRSMFQETVLRNMPFCDEFIILTNARYENVVRAQLQVFQGLDYKLVLEDTPLKTAPPVYLLCQSFSGDEELMITPSDSIINGDYNTALSSLKEAVKCGKFAAITCKPRNYGPGYNYLKIGKKVYFGEKASKGCLWDTGIWGAKASVLLAAFGSEFRESCNRLKLIDGRVCLNEAENFTPVSLIKVIFPADAVTIPATFEWARITDISSYYKFYENFEKGEKNAVYNNTNGVEIINMSNDRLIVANGIKNIAVVNTRDAIFVTAKSAESDIKSIISANYPSRKKYFDQQPKSYKPWGTTELMATAQDCRVKSVTVFKGNSFSLKPAKNTAVNLFVTSGNLLLKSLGNEEEYFENQSLAITDRTEYTVANNGKGDLKLILIEKTRSDEDIKRDKTEYLVKMKPAFKDNLWGGTKIRDVLGKNVGNMDVIAESWELSAHRDGQSRVAFGEFAGQTLGEYVQSIGRERLGWKAQAYDEFPILVKFIDAKQNLSLQVHPADEYAMAIEGQYGKNEMWHVLEADEGACIYVGFNKDVTAEEIKRHIADNTLMQVVNKIPVKAGETYFLKAGTVHAIGEGCFICEIQQSSNVTYRLYDYGRRDKNGNLRELSIDKALDVLDMRRYTPVKYDDYEKIIRSDYVKTLIGQCKYFTVNKYFIDGECDFPVMEASFQCFVILAGEGTISDGVKQYKITRGDTWFCASRVQVTVSGKCRLLTVNI